jgi:hypothetical protein
MNKKLIMSILLAVVVIGTTILVVKNYATGCDSCGTQTETSTTTTTESNVEASQITQEESPAETTNPAGTPNSSEIKDEKTKNESTIKSSTIKSCKKNGKNNKSKDKKNTSAVKKSSIKVQK